MQRIFFLKASFLLLQKENALRRSKASYNCLILTTNIFPAFSDKKPHQKLYYIFFIVCQSSLKIGFCLYTSYSKTVSRKKFISNHISKQRFCSTGPQKQYRVQAITRRSCKFKEFPSVTDPKISEEKKKKQSQYKIAAPCSFFKF